MQQRDESICRINLVDALLVMYAITRRASQNCDSNTTNVMTSGLCTQIVLKLSTIDQQDHYFDVA